MSGRLIDLARARRALAMLDAAVQRWPHLAGSEHATEDEAIWWESELGDDEETKMAEKTIRQFRLEDELVQRLDRYASWFADRNTAFEVNRTTALRAILLEKLAAWDAMMAACGPTIDRILELADAANASHRKSEDGIDWSTVELEPSRAERDLEDYVESMSPDLLEEIVWAMYVGRGAIDGSGVPSRAEVLQGRRTHEDRVRAIVEKQLRLRDYFSEYRASLRTREM